jgi:hypothetical protein
MALFVIYDLATEKVRGCEEHPEGGIPKPGAGWGVLAVDHRIDTQRGDRVSEGAYVPYAPTFADTQAAKVATAEAFYGGLITAGFTYNGVRFQIDPQSQTQLAAMSLMALGNITDPVNSPWPAGFYWVAADNSHVPMDAPGLYAFGRAVAGYVSGCILHLRAIKDEIASAPDQSSPTPSM